VPRSAFRWIIPALVLAAVAAFCLWHWRPAPRPVPLRAEDQRAAALLAAGDYREALVAVTESLERHGPSAFRHDLRRRVLEQAGRPDLAALSRSMEQQSGNTSATSLPRVLSPAPAPLAPPTTNEPGADAHLIRIAHLAAAGDTNALWRMRNDPALTEVVRAEAWRCWRDAVPHPE
jgi:hypothetical protein